MLKGLWGLLVFFLIANTSPVSAEPVKSIHSEAELIAEQNSVQPGKPFWIGIHLKLYPNWHTYWINPGDSGLATRVELKLPAGFQASALKWPAPKLIREKEIVVYGYEKELLLMAEITPPENSPEPAITIAAKARWLVCEIACFPGKADLEMTLPVKNETPDENEQKMMFDQVRKKWPVKISANNISAMAEQKKIILRFKMKTQNEFFAYFFPASVGLINYNKSQILRENEGSFKLEIPRSSLRLKLPRNLQGILSLGPENQFFEVDTPLEEKSLWKNFSAGVKVRKGINIG